jgi:8-oxo-dGTP diphosphatase
MKNFPVKDNNGKEWWISRSVCVVGLVFCECDGIHYVLANKRGKGTPDFQGYWNVPCGYLDYDETTEEAVIREIYEETGVSVPGGAVRFWRFNDSPKDDARQNVSFRYVVLLCSDNLPVAKITGEGEKDEVDEIKWIPIDEITNYKWAFNHKDLIRQSFNDFYMGSVRSKNVGSSDYSKHSIQPWDIWLEYNLNPWDADIVKRVLRKKSYGDKSETEARIEDYEKIIHVCQERIRQLTEPVEKDSIELLNDVEMERYIDALKKYNDVQLLITSSGIGMGKMIIHDNNIKEDITDYSNW